jgi:hypothetical protein
VDKLEAIEEESGKCTVLMRELQSLHNARLVVSFNVDEAAQEREINMKTGEITEVFRRAERLLKEFSKLGKSITLTLTLTLLLLLPPL